MNIVFVLIKMKITFKIFNNKTKALYKIFVYKFNEFKKYKNIETKLQ